MALIYGRMKGRTEKLPKWPLLLKYLDIQNKPKKLRPGEHPSRIERILLIKWSKIPEADRKILLAMEMLCPAGCGRTINPVVMSTMGMYYHASCLVKVDSSCFHTKACQNEIDSVIAAARESRGVVHGVEDAPEGTG